MKKRFVDTIGILKEAEAGRMKMAALCRKYGISDATFYNRKARFGGTTEMAAPQSVIDCGV